MQDSEIHPEEVPKKESLPDTYGTTLRILKNPITSRGGICGLLQYAKSIGTKETLLRTMGLIRRVFFSRFDKFYDWRHNLNTSGHIKAEDIDAEDFSRKYSEPYAPTPARSMRTMLDAVPVEFSEYSFVDYGCGKGRTLLIASELPFRRIIGIEHSNILAQMASNNIEVFRNNTNHKAVIKVLHQDASNFEPPSGPCLFYFYSPFRGAVLNAVVEQIGQSYDTSPRPMIVLFSEDTNTIDIPTQLFQSVADLKLYKSSSLPFDIGASVPLIYAIFANSFAIRLGS